MKLYDSGLKIMDVIWKEGDIAAKKIAALLRDQTGWNVNTTYTLIKRCIAKGAVERREPGFLCRALITREQVQEEATNELVEKVFDGSREQLFASLLGHKSLNARQIEKLRRMVDELE